LLSRSLICMACEIMLYQIRIVECCLLLVEVGKISE